MSRRFSTVPLALLFFVIVTPTAIVMRLLGRDLLGLRYDRRATSYWLPVPGADNDPIR